MSEKLICKQCGRFMGLMSKDTLPELPEKSSRCCSDSWYSHYLKVSKQKNRKVLIRIIVAVSQNLDIKVSSIRGNHSSKDIAFARKVYACIAIRYGIPFIEIDEYINKKSFSRSPRVDAAKEDYLVQQMVGWVLDDMKGVKAKVRT